MTPKPKPDPAQTPQQTLIVNVNAPPILLVTGGNLNAEAIRDMVAEALRQIAATGLSGAALPAHLDVPALPVPARIAPENPASAQAAGVSFEDFCLDDLHSSLYTGWKTISPSTFRESGRLLRQMAREGVPLDPPDWRQFWDWATRHKKGRVALDNHRKAYNRLLAYYGMLTPPQLGVSWAPKKAVEKARRENRIREQIKHFRNGPLDVAKLLDATPWGRRRPLQNAMFQHAVILCALAGPRGGEPADLLVENLRAERLEIRNWWQEKKDERRNIVVPEAWFWDGPGATVRHYLEEVRPQLAHAAEDHYFVATKGRAWTCGQTWANFLRGGVEKTLGYPIGAHAFRRFCATTRYAWGWSVEEIARYLHDNADTVRTHYIDHSFANMVAHTVPKRNKTEARPALPPLRHLPEIFGLNGPKEVQGSSAYVNSNNVDNSKRTLT